MHHRVINFLHLRHHLPGQGSGLQFSILVSFPWQSSPPLRAALFITRFSFFVPPLHVFEHSDSSCHDDQTQETGRNISNQQTEILKMNVIMQRLRLWDLK